ncbi:hypothetical protein AN1V17_50790 [Vallitalea sediminicola]
MRYKRLILLIVIALLIVSACIFIRHKNKQIAALKEGNYRIIPDELFKGEIKDIEPHLNWKSGKYVLKYDGDSYWLNVIFEIWEDGKRIDTSSTAMSGEEPLNSEFSFSIKPDDNEKSEFIYVLNNNVSYTNPDINFKLGNMYKAGKAERLEKAVDIPVGNEIAIWGYYKYQDGSFRTRNGIEEYAK